MRLIINHALSRARQLLVASAGLLALFAGSVLAHYTTVDNRNPNIPPFGACPAGKIPRWHYQESPTNGPYLPSDYAYSEADIHQLCWTWANPFYAHGILITSWPLSTGDSSYGSPTCGRRIYPSGDHNNLHVSDGQFNFAYSCATTKLFVAVPRPKTKDLGKCAACVRNPIGTATGNKFQEEVDYESSGPFPLKFSRSYNSQDNRTSSDVRRYLSDVEDPERYSIQIGNNWMHTLSLHIYFDFGTNPIYDPNGIGTKNSGLYTTAQSACESGWPQIRAKAVGLANTTATYQGSTCVLKEGTTVRGTLPVYTDPHGHASWNAQALVIDRPDGKSYRFTVSGTSPNFVYTAEPGLTAKLEATANGYRLTDNDVVEEYSAYGYLNSIKSRAGVTQTFTYTGRYPSSVTDSFGRTMSFTLDPTSHKILTLTNPDGKVYTYAYNANGDMATVTYPDNKVRTYHYENPSFPHALTGITDENNNRFATWTYDSMGRAYISQHAGGADRTELTFNADGTTTVKDALNTQRVMSLTQVNGTYLPTGTTQPCAMCGTSSASRTYDANGFPNLVTDFNGNVTDYDYNSRGLETQRIEAVGSSLQRTITTQWHATYRLPTQVDEPGRRTTFTYDASGNRLTQTILDTATSEARTTTWTYNALGQVLTVNGPRTDVSDITTYHYTSQGNLDSITNALGQITTIDQYDAHGNPGRIIDPNGVTTTLAYDLRQRLTSRTVAGKATSFEYYGAGQLKKVTLPDNSYVSYTYDTAQRLTDVSDNAGNKIHYTLDALGNRTAEEVLDPSSVLKRKQSQVFEALGRLQKIKNAAGDVISEFGYDTEGNRTSQVDHIDGLTTVTTGFTPDSLNRIKQITDAASGITQYGYNALDQLTSVTDPKSLVTSYTLNALGDVKQQVSPDTGTTGYTVDAAGNRKSQTDARGITANYSYDALNRLILVDYPGTAEDVTYSYDGTNYSPSAANGVGRLTGVVDESGTTTLFYDTRGNLIQEARLFGGTTYSTSYNYDSADRVTSILYPSGRLATYERNTLGQVSKVTTTLDGVTTTLADNIAYMPFGGIKAYTLGNGVVVTRSFDSDYQLEEIKGQGTATVQDLKLYYDLRSNITSTEDLVTAGRSQSFDYDALSRLSSAQGEYGTQGYTYDGVGNRLTETITPPGGSPTTSTYDYPSSSHRLSSISDGPGFTYDDMGNITAKGSLTLSYNNAARMISASGGPGSLTAVYNAAGQRVKKSAGGVNTLFHYDRAGHLLAEQPDSGQILGREYVWLEDIPLVVATDRNISDYYVDNSDSSFSTTGSWTLATASGQYGGNYMSRGPAVEVPGETIVDDIDTGASFTGVWTPGGYCEAECPPLLDMLVSSEAPYGTTFLYSQDVDTPVFTWSAAVSPGRYRVYVRWVPVTGSGSATYAVTHASGTAGYPVDQSLSSNGWYVLGSYTFDSSATVTLTPDPGVVAVADAVRIVPIEDTDNDIATWLASGEVGTYDVFVRWPTVSGASGSAPFSIVDAAGATPAVKDQTANSAQWNLLGTFTFDDPATQGVKLGAAWDNTVLADAVHFVPVDEYARRSELAYFHVDQLNTPQRLTDANQNVVWDASYEPFGDAEITKQNDFDSSLRLPGQYFDSETGLYQNWFRDYDPSIGRYLQADPIGLLGGPNPYGYALQNPLQLTDLFGLAPEEEDEVTRSGRAPLDPASYAVELARDRVESLTNQIRRYDSSFQYATIAPRSFRYGQQDIELLTELLEQYEQAGSCPVETRPPIRYGNTPAGRPFTRHYGTETGPVRNLPGSLLDHIVENSNPIPGRGESVIYYDPVNDVSVVMGRNGVMSARRGQVKGQ